MRCPVCGAKLVAKQICPYCKITDEQITAASNRKVKEYRKTGNGDLICYTTVIPNDLSKVKIIGCSSEREILKRINLKH